MPANNAGVKGRGRDLQIARGLPLPLTTRRLEKLSGKGTGNVPSVDLTAIRRANWTEKVLIGGSQGAVADVFVAFRTVSECVFSET
jgi:hypothetical protein